MNRYYVHATYTVGPRRNGDGFDVREMPRMSGLDRPTADALARFLRASGCWACVGFDHPIHGPSALDAFHQTAGAL